MLYRLFAIFVLAINFDLTVLLGQGWQIASRMTDGQDVGLLIVGAITNADKHASVALVKNVESGRILAVKAGFPVLKGFKVVSVEPKFITIAKGSETILVFQNKFAAEFLGRNNSSATALGPSVAANDVYQEEGFERRGTKVTVTDSFRNKMINEDLSKVLMQATAVPYLENGAIVGFKVLQIDSGSIYDKLGMKDYDVIKSINGVRLDNVSGAVRLLQSLRNASEVKVDLSRGGAPLQLELNVAH